MEITKRTTWSLLMYFCRCYPVQSIVVIISLILAGLSETLGIGALLPLISIIIGGESQSDNILASLTSDFYAFLGMEPSLTNLLAFIVAAITAKSVVIFYAMRYVSYVSADVSRDLRMRLISALMSAEWPYFTSLPTGRVANSVSMEALRAGQFYMLSGRMVACSIQALVYILAAFVVSWKISVIAIIIGSTAALCLRWLIGMARDAGQDLTNANNGMLARLNESLMGVKSLKAMGQEKHHISYLQKDTFLVMKARKKQALSSLLLQIIYEPLAVILLSFGLYFVLTYTEISVAAVILLAFLFYRLLSQVNQIQGFYQNMVNNESAAWQLMDEIDEAKAACDQLTGTLNPTLADGIEFDSVSIAYAKNAPVLRAFNASIPANKFTVVFGPSGVGKTTVVDAILKLVAPQEGEIRIDGKVLNEIDAEKWREMIGYVPQETFLFHDTVLANVTLGEKSYSEVDVRQALEMAGAWDFVCKLPEGVKTIVGERGGKLSGGQRQRIALARALIRSPALLVLDESTTGLDQESEERVFKAIESLKDQVTVIAISHDKSILKRADHVVHMDASSREAA